MVLAVLWLNRAQLALELFQLLERIGERGALLVREVAIVALGATELDPVTDVGGGMKVAAVTDPFGNRSTTGVVGLGSRSASR